MDVPEIPDPNFAAEPGLNAADRHSAEKCHRDLRRRGLEAGCSRTREPFVDDPSLIFGMHDRQVGVVAEYLLGLVPREQQQNHFMDIAQLRAGRVFAPNDLDALRLFTIAELAYRIIAGASQQQGAFLRLSLHDPAQLDQRDRAHGVPVVALDDLMDLRHFDTGIATRRACSAPAFFISQLQQGSFGGLPGREGSAPGQLQMNVCWLVPHREQSRATV